MALIENMDSDNLYFHASGMNCMNDSSEFLYGFKEFRRMLPAMEKRIGDIEESLKLSTTIDTEDRCLKGKWNERFVDIHFEGNKTPFVVSTSANSNSIPMWAMYGDAGGGIALGFDISNYYVPIKTEEGKEVHDMTKCDFEGIHAMKVVHNLFLGHPAIIYSMGIYKKYIENAKNASDDSEIMKLKLKALYEMSVLTSALVKHPAFKFENEWRILSLRSSTNDVLYKMNSKNQLVSYLKLGIPPKALKKVVIGPCNDGIQQKRLIKQILTKNNICECKVTYSLIPYKG